VAKLLEDAEAGRLGTPAAGEPDAIDTWLRERVPGLCTWEGWLNIDGHETAAGAPAGRPRVKVVRMADLQRIAAGA
jgi:ferredoxin--NADP+ reductase